MTDKQVVTIRVPKEHIDYIVKVAEMSGVSVDDVVSVILATFILRQGKEES